jgi:adenylate cyclase
VEPLSPDETRELVASLAAPLEDELRAVALARAAGNPFFAEELTRYLRERGRGGDVPETIRDLLTARIDRLAEPLKRTLQVAAVLGREFPLSLIEAIAPGPQLEPHLAGLVAQELLRQKDVLPEPSFLFSHLLVQEVAYEGLLVKARAELHARVGQALERLHADRLDDVVAELAEHYARAGDRDNAVRFLTQAGDRAASLFAYAEAERAYTRALERVDPGDDDRRGPLLDRIGDVSFAHGALGDALARWEQALGLGIARGDRRRVADLHRKMAVACWAAGKKDEALAHLDRSLDALGDDAENLEAARLYNEAARIHFRLGRHGRAIEWARQALGLGERLAAADVVSHAYNTLGVAVARDGDLEAGAEHVARSLEAALGAGLAAVACRAYTNLAVMHASLDPAASERYCRDGLALAEKIGDRLQQAWLYCVLAGGHCTIAGDYDEGVRAAELAVELDEHLGQQNHLPVPLIILGQIHQCRGDHDRGEHYYRRALAVAESVGEPQLLVPCYEGLATLAIERDQEADADAWLAKSRAVQQLTGWTADTFLVLPFLC